MLVQENLTDELVGSLSSKFGARCHTNCVKQRLMHVQSLCKLISCKGLVSHHVLLSGASIARFGFQESLDNITCSRSEQHPAHLALTALKRYLMG